MCCIAAPCHLSCPELKNIQVHLQIFICENMSSKSDWTFDCCFPINCVLGDLASLAYLMSVADSHNTRCVFNLQLLFWTRNGEYNKRRWVFKQGGGERLSFYTLSLSICISFHFEQIAWSFLLVVRRITCFIVTAVLSDRKQIHPKW